MSRYYQTDKGSYLQNIAYQSPLELLDKALATQQQGYDNAVNSTALFNNLDIKYLDSEEERANVNNIKKYYEGKANEIVNALQANPNDWRKHQSSIRNLSRELQQDMQTGNISKIQGSYAQKQAYDTRMEELRKKDPIRYQVAVAQANKTWGGNSLTNGLWNQEDIIATPDWNKMLKENLANLKANIQSRSVEAPDGRGYIIDNSYRVESLSDDKLMGYLAHQIMGDSNIQAWAAQSQRFGLGKYYDDEGKMIPLFREEEVLDENGKLVGKKMSANPNSGFYHQLSQAQLQAYTQDERSTKTKNDNAVLQQMAQAHAVRMAHLNSSLAKKNEEDKFMYELRKEAIINNNPHAKEVLGQMTANSFIATNSVFETDLGKVQQAIKDGDKSQEILYQKAQAYAKGKSNYSSLDGNTTGIDYVQFLLDKQLDTNGNPISKEKAIAQAALRDSSMKGVDLNKKISVQDKDNVARHTGSYFQEISVAQYLENPDRYKTKDLQGDLGKAKKVYDRLSQEYNKYEKDMGNYFKDVYNPSQSQQTYVSLNIEGSEALKTQIKNYTSNFNYTMLDENADTYGKGFFNYKKNPKGTIGKLDSTNDLGEYRVIGVNPVTPTGRVGILVESNELGRVVLYPDFSKSGNDQLNNNIINISAGTINDKGALPLFGNSRVQEYNRKLNAIDNESGISSFNDSYKDNSGKNHNFRVIKNSQGIILDLDDFNEPIILPNTYQLDLAIEQLKQR